MKKQNNKTTKKVAKVATKKVTKVANARSMPATMEPINGYYNRKQAAKLFKISIYALDQLVIKNVLKSLKVEVVKTALKKAA